ncbi:MAG: hypothetical protein ABI672_14995 [Vicinamibacteria bacterium]
MTKTQTTTVANRSGFLRALLVLAVVGLPLFLAPGLIRGFAARDWVSYYTSLDTLPRPRKNLARAITEKADLAIQGLAPLPQASSAAIEALTLGERLQNAEHDREAALIIYQGVRAACVAVQARPLSGVGFAVIEARAAALENSARVPAVSPSPSASPATTTK